MELGKNNEEKDKTNILDGIILRRLDDKVNESKEDGAESFFNGYDAKLAVLDAEGNPYGVVDKLLIDKNPDNLIIITDDGRPSIEIMSEAIKRASAAGLSSLAIPADTEEEIELVKQEIVDQLKDNRQMTKIGFYYPKNINKK
jgi:hypothetical protein